MSLQPWQQNIVFLSVLYAIAEQKKQFTIPLLGDEAFVEPIARHMVDEGYLTITNRVYGLTKAGEEFRGRMVAMYDQLLKFEVFGTVNQTIKLTEEQSPDGMSVYDNLLDPTFAPSPKSEDLRLAMLDWYGTAAEPQLNGKSVDLHLVVFMQRLRANKYGKLDGSYWYDLRQGKVFADVDAIVTSAVRWQQLGANDEESVNVMNALYTAGMSEQIKRDGERCTCGAYLGMYQYYAAKEGKALDECPSCNASFKAPPPATAGEACPNCGTDILPRQRKCHGCNAHIDRSMSAGSVRETTTATTITEAVYDPYYDFDPYSPWGMSYVDYGYYPPAPVYPGVWYDPYDPIANVVAFGLICALF